MSGWRLVDLCAYYVRLSALAAILAAAFAMDADIWAGQCEYGAVAIRSPGREVVSLRRSHGAQNGGRSMRKENEAREQREKREVDDELNRQLEETFPASDPLKVTRSIIPATQITPKPDTGDEKTG